MKRPSRDSCRRNNNVSSRDRNWFVASTKKMRRECKSRGKSRVWSRRKPNGLKSCKTQTRYRLQLLGNSKVRWTATLTRFRSRRASSEQRCSRRVVQCVFSWQMRQVWSSSEAPTASRPKREKGNKTQVNQSVKLNRKRRADTSPSLTKHGCSIWYWEVICAWVCALF